LNQSNAADQRVFELLEQKFHLFEGIFGSSDEILGTIEDGFDFEKRILGIYQTCRTREEIKTAFDDLQKELSDQIDERMTEARQSILENFDEEVAARLRDCNTDTINELDKFTKWLFNFFLMHGAERMEPLDQFRFEYVENNERKVYNLRWKDAEAQNDIFLRRDDPMCHEWLMQSTKDPLPAASIRFDYSNSGRNFAFLTEHPNLQGIISVDKLAHKGIEDEEHLILSVVTEDGTHIDDETIHRIRELPTTITGYGNHETEELIARRQTGIDAQKAEIENRNKDYYLEQCDKLDAYTEELKEGLQQELKKINRVVNEKRKETRKMQKTATLKEILDHQDEIIKLESRQKLKRRELFEREEEIERQRDALRDEARRRLNGEIETETIMVLCFEII
jgi:hypothetical protein